MFFIFVNFLINYRQFLQKIKKIKTNNYQFLVLVLHLQPGCYAVSGVEEGPSLALLRQVVDEDAHEVDGDEDDDVGGDRLPVGQQVEVGVEEDHGDDGVETGEQEAVGHSEPSPGNILTKRSAGTEPFIINQNV